MDFLRVRKTAAILAAMATVFGISQRVHALDSVFVPATGDYNVNNNWDTLNVPAAVNQQRAVIEGGSVATLSSTAPVVGGVVLGLNVGNTGTLTIETGGSLTSQVSASTLGFVEVGVPLGGTGTLNMTGGTLNASVGLRAANNALNAINLSGAATLTTPNAQLGGTTRVTGPGVNFSSSNFTLQGPSNLIAGVTGATHSPLKASGVATIGGVMNVEFSGAFAGVAPAFGQKFRVVDAGAIAGTFNNAGNVGVTGVPAPALGEVYRVTRSTGGTFGQVLEVSREKALVLQVNRDTGQMFIINPQNGAIEIDGYQVRSAVGSLEPVTWNSLDEQNVAGWEEGSSSGNSIGELNTSTTFNFNNVPSQQLGVAYDEGNSFFVNGIGAVGNDLVFTYSEPDLPAAITGAIQYIGTGRTNTLKLTIDPATGRARLRNDAPGPITIQGYSILSSGSALLPGGFTEATVPTLTSAGPAAATAISELATSPSSSLTIAGDSHYDFTNAIFDTSFTQMTAGITLEFVTSAQALFNGVVEFASLAAGIDGDYNNDGIVDAVDYTVWRNNLGDVDETDLNGNGDGGGVTASDYTFWKTRYGNTSGSGGLAGAANVVPEPPSCLMLLLAFAALGVYCRR